MIELLSTLDSWSHRHYVFPSSLKVPHVFQDYLFFFIRVTIALNSFPSWSCLALDGAFPSRPLKELSSCSVQCWTIYLSWNQSLPLQSNSKLCFRISKFLIGDFGTCRHFDLEVSVLRQRSPRFNNLGQSRLPLHTPQSQLCVRSRRASQDLSCILFASVLVAFRHRCIVIAPKERL